MDDLQRKRLEKDIEYGRASSDKLADVYAEIGQGFPPAISAELERRGLTPAMNRKLEMVFYGLSSGMTRIISLTNDFEQVMGVLSDVTSIRDPHPTYHVDVDAPDHLQGEERWLFVQAARYIQAAYLEIMMVMLCQDDPPTVAVARQNAYDVCAFIFDVGRQLMA